MMVPDACTVQTQNNDIMPNKNKENCYRTAAVKNGFNLVSFLLSLPVQYLLDHGYQTQRN